MSTRKPYTRTTPSSSRSRRIAATAALLLAAGALSAPAATAQTSSADSDGAYVLRVGTDRATTDSDHRRVTVTVTATHADGTPAAGIPVRVEETLVFETWNPWYDPIDPNYYESRSLGTPVTGADGTVTIPDVLIDHEGSSSLLDSRHEVWISASYDADGDPNTVQDGYYADTTVSAQTESSSVSYHLNKTKVKAGDILTVDGTVTVPAGQEAQGTEVFLRTYWEGEWRVKTEAEDDGSFVLSARIRDYDNEFALLTAPRDYYTAGVDQPLPVTNQSL